MAGALSALTFMPTAIPLIWQIIRIQETLGLRHTTAVAYSVHASLRAGLPPDEDTLSSYSVGHLSTQEGDKPWVTFGHALAPSVAAQVCTPTPRSGVVQSTRRELWAAACVEGEGLKVLAAMRLDSATPAQSVMGMVLMLGIFVGIVTALGILRLLRPVSEITNALVRVGAGERGVNVSRTGLAELDALVDRLNAAARSVDDREDAILSRIELVQEMARIVAHEIRNPLQSLSLLTSLIASEDDPAERTAIAESIDSEIRTLEQVVHRLLRESTAQGSLRLQLVKQPITPLVEQVVALRRPQANNQGVRLNIGGLSWTEVSFDPALVKRSIENLLLNSLQAVPRHTGEIRISVIDNLTPLEPPPPGTKGPHIAIVVEDNGPGVPADLKEHIFEPNVTGRPDGTGLGLALVKGVIEAHNGYMRYGRSPLGGARFEAHLPVAQESTEERPKL